MNKFQLSILVTLLALLTLATLSSAYGYRVHDGAGATKFTSRPNYRGWHLLECPAATLINIERVRFLWARNPSRAKLDKLNKKCDGKPKCYFKDEPRSFGLYPYRGFKSIITYNCGTGNATEATLAPFKVCYKRPVSESPDRYEQSYHGRWFQMWCPKGTVFSQDTCSCVIGSTDPGHAAGTTEAPIKPLITDNNCEPNLCENGGVCVDKVNDFFCRCTKDFTGAVCEKACDKRPVPGIANEYDHNIDGQWIQVPCDEGQTFDEEACDCHTTLTPEPEQENYYWRSHH